MAKRKKQTKKPSIAAILGMILLGLVAIGVVANVIKDNLKEEEDPIVDVESGGDETEEYKLIFEDGPITEIVIPYEEGMTWTDLITFSEEDEFLWTVGPSIKIEDSCYSIRVGLDTVSPEDEIDLSVTYRLVQQ